MHHDPKHQPSNHLRHAALADAFLRVCTALGTGKPPNIDQLGDRNFRFTMTPAAGYMGLVALIADMELIGSDGEDVVRVHWSTRSEATQSTAERAADDAHEAAGRANRILSDALGGWIAQEDDDE